MIRGGRCTRSGRSSRVRPEIKICGITNLDDALRCARLGADMLGFIFFEQSPRYIPPRLAGGIIRRLPSALRPVGVFVNESRENILKAVDASGVQIIQLSGDEVPGDCENYPLDVWKAFRLIHPDEV